MDAVLPGLNEIESAARLIYQTMPATPQYSWPLINARAGAEVWVKHENHTQVGAFKVRGGLVYMDWLRRGRPQGKRGGVGRRGGPGAAVGFWGGAVCTLAVFVVAFVHSPGRERGETR